MCGIAGLYRRNGNTVREADLTAMAAAIAHRGPDEARAWARGCIGLASRRFALEDIPGGSQPAIYQHITVVWNGEIFNWRELAAKHDLAGVTGDTSLLPRLFAEVGEAALAELNGQFAIAVWNEQEQSLLLARDPAGILPLHYAEQGDRVSFASELRALALDADLSREADTAALAHFFRMGFFAAPTTPYKAIRQLAPGWAVKFTRDEAKLFQFFRPTMLQDFTGSLADAGEQMAALMVEAVRRRLSESPQGLFLSGGVDSALLAAALKKLGVDMPAFTVGFQGANETKDYHFRQSFERAREVYNEFVEADGTSDGLGLPRAVRVAVGENALTARLAEIVHWLDSPCMSISAPPLFFLTGQAAQSIRVAHSGGGADELFAGYAHVDPGHYLNAGSVVGKYLELTQIFSPEELTAIGSPYAAEAEAIRETLPQTVAEQTDVGPGVLPFVLAAERLGPLPQNILQKNDRIGMRMPLEMRYPFLDRQVIDFAQSLPDHLLAAGGEGKLAVKEAAEMLGVPTHVTRRKKVRLQAPYATYLNEPQVREYFKDIIANPPTWPQRPYDPDKALKALLCDNVGQVWRRPAKVLLLATWNLWIADRLNL